MFSVKQVEGRFVMFLDKTIDDHPKAGDARLVDWSDPLGGEIYKGQAESVLATWGECPHTPNARWEWTAKCPDNQCRQETACERLKLTPDEFRELVKACQRTWKKIGPDVLHSVLECGDHWMGVTQIIEVTLDADHVQMYGEITSPNVLACITHPMPHYHTLLLALEPYFSEERV